MANYPALRRRAEQLAERDWPVSEMESRYERLLREGVRRDRRTAEEIVAQKPEILDRVQRRAEEYNVLGNNCPRATALALMEEFGLGTMDVVKALGPFPSIAGTGSVCGGVSGALAAFGLFFGADDIRDQEAVGAAMMASGEFVSRFEAEVGSTLCAEIQERAIFGQYMDPGASPGHMEAFVEAKGPEKCSLLPGIGARIAADIIIESMR